MRTTIEVATTNNTPGTAPVRRNYSLPLSHLSHIDVRIPAGHKGLAFLQISIPGHGIVIPGSHSTTSFIRGEAEELSFDFDINLEPPRNQISVCWYNEDFFLSHTFILDFFTEMRL